MNRSVCLILFSCACQAPAQLEDTRVFIRILNAGGPVVDQLRVVGLQGDKQVLGPIERPEKTSGAALQGEQSIVLIVPDELDQRTVSFRVTGLWQGAPRVSGMSSLQLKRRQLVAAEVKLDQPVAPCDDGRKCGAGQRCVDGACVCDDVSCAGGCCADNECQGRAFDSCGAGGGACSRCDEVLADSCSGAGACACGDGPPCGAGARCRGGTCVCDNVSCSGGCCSGNTCMSRAASTCGVAGGVCRACDAKKTDTCSATGACLCGGGSPCGKGQHCAAGKCVCDASACAGCCTALEGGQCLVGSDAANCGRQGNLCQPCESCSADGVCSTCGPNNCHGNSCCVAGTCTGQGVQANQMVVCGVGAEACVACTAGKADGCTSAGDCSCGSGGQECRSDQVCRGGACVCDPSTCPQGCCDAQQQCVIPTFPAHGSGGEACQACDPTKSDRVDGGVCRCGAQGACGDGQRCDAGQTSPVCVCDGASCPGGCCTGDTCLPYEAQSSVFCGTGGAVCAFCFSSDFPGGSGDGVCVNGVCQ